MPNARVQFKALPESGMFSQIDRHLAWGASESHNFLTSSVVVEKTAAV